MIVFGAHFIDVCHTQQSVGPIWKLQVRVWGNGLNGLLKTYLCAKKWEPSHKGGTVSGTQSCLTFT